MYDEAEKLLEQLDTIIADRKIILNKNISDLIVKCNETANQFKNFSFTHLNEEYSRVMVAVNSLRPEVGNVSPEAQRCFDEVYSNFSLYRVKAEVYIVSKF